MKKRSALISGAGIAGPALALCLEQCGIASTIVERAPQLREGGQAVDFRGPIHRRVLEALGLWGAIHERRTKPSALVFVDQSAKELAVFPEVMMSGDVEILRGDLVQLLYEKTHHTTDYRFGDRSTALQEEPDGVQVTFERSAPQRFDLVIGADGLHSGVRELLWGAAPGILRHHGYRLATFSMPNTTGASSRALVYSEPGRATAIFALTKEARALLVYAAPPLTKTEGREVEALRRSIQRFFAGALWETPRILAALETATDLYVDDIATVHVDKYSQGRVALLGDAAFGGTLGGQGTSLSVVGAYVLSGELARAGTHLEAFARYESVMRGYATRCQRGAMRVGSFFAPKTRAGLVMRNLMYRALTSRPMLGLFERMVKDAATDLKLPQYDIFSAAPQKE
jgi:2-polyprenyl-6-methoxyphenol hydroxylase-like FAD-dependent oxidoreductase